MKRIVISLLFLLSFFSAFAQGLKQRLVGTTSNVSIVSFVPNTSYTIQFNLASFQGYSGAQVQVGDQYVVEYTLTTPKKAIRFQISSVSVVSGNRIQVTMIPMDGATLIVFPVTTGQVYRSGAGFNLIPVDGSAPMFLEAAVRNHNTIRIDSLLKNHQDSINFILATLGGGSGGSPAILDSLARTNNITGLFTSDDIPYAAANGRLDRDGILKYVSGQVQANSFAAVGTAGAGYFGAPTQSSTPSTPASGFRLYASSANPNSISTVGQDGYTRTFITTGITTNRTWQFPDVSGTVAILEGSQTFTGNNIFQLSGSGGSGFNFTGTGKFVVNAPPMTTAQRDALTTLTEGAKIFNLTTHRPNYWDGTSWKESIGVASGGLTNTWVGVGDASGNISGSSALTFSSIGLLNSSGTSEHAYTYTNTTSSTSASLMVGSGSAVTSGYVGMFRNSTAVFYTDNSSVIWTPPTWRLASNANSLTIVGGFGAATLGTSIVLNPGTFTAGGFTATSGTQVNARVGGSNNTWQPTSGNATWNMFQVDGVINTSGAYAGTVRGVYYNPTRTSVTGVTHRAWESTSGDMVVTNGNFSTSGTITATGSITSSTSFRTGPNATNFAILPSETPAAQVGIGRTFGNPGHTAFFEHDQGLPRQSWLFTSRVSGTVTRGYNNAENAIIRIAMGFSEPNASGVNGNVLEINPTYNKTNSNTSTIRGVYYNPIITSFGTNTTHRAWESTSGNFIINGGQVGIGTSSPVASALVEMASTTAGFLAPRMTTVQRDAIATPASFLRISNTNTNTNQYYFSSSWWDEGSYQPNFLSVGTTSVPANVALQVISTTKMSIPAPVMLSAQRDLLTGIEAGMVYSSTSDEYQHFDATNNTFVGLVKKGVDGFFTDQSIIYALNPAGENIVISSGDFKFNPYTLTMSIAGEHTGIRLGHDNGTVSIRRPAIDIVSTEASDNFGNYLFRYVEDSHADSFNIEHIAGDIHMTNTAGDIQLFAGIDGGAIKVGSPLVITQAVPSIGATVTLDGRNSSVLIDGSTTTLNLPEISFPATTSDEVDPGFIMYLTIATSSTAVAVTAFSGQTIRLNGSAVGSPVSSFSTTSGNVWTGILVANSDLTWSVVGN